MTDKQKTIEVDEQSSCYSSGTMPHYEAEAMPEHIPQMERILVLGSGCPKCRALEQTVLQALDEMNVNELVGHVSDYAEMAKFGVMSTPALVINGKVVSAGRVLNAKEVLKLLQENLII